jgi:predicted nucleic acid-binding protein
MAEGGRVRFSLDSNLLVYAAHGGDEKNAIAVAVIERASRGDCVQPLQSLGECFNALVRKRRLTSADAAVAVEKIRAVFPIIAADEEVFAASLVIIRDFKLQFWDALFLATVRRAGARVLLSEDMNDGQDIAGVKLVNPFKPENAGIVSLVLPPAEH